MLAAKTEQSLILWKYKQSARPCLRQTRRQSPVLARAELVRSGVVASMQTVWLPERYKPPGLGPERLEDQLPANASQDSLRVNALRAVNCR
jgi:hypothetical protein